MAGGAVQQQVQGSAGMLKGKTAVALLTPSKLLLHLLGVLRETEVFVCQAGQGQGSSSQRSVAADQRRVGHQAAAVV